jgi:hypothetical protein
MRHNWMPKETKGTGERKIHFEESESDLHTDREENRIYDDDFSDDGDI